MLLSIKDNLGKTVYSTKLNVQKGSNSTTLSGLSRFNGAVYNIVIQMEEDITSKKLIIQH
jgi:hypothetical protein